MSQPVGNGPMRPTEGFAEGTVKGREIRPSDAGVFLALEDESQLVNSRSTGKRCWVCGNDIGNGCLVWRDQWVEADSFFFCWRHESCG